jgi:bifunctional DNA-binding transcriptional regulator/antitoxin component of YhaV-PrlF toxin-antitoxin module
MSLIRGLDNQRRLTIPKETLRAVGADVGDFMKIYAANTPTGEPCITLEKFEPGCALCGGEANRNYKLIHGKRVCEFCAKVLK